MAPEMVDDCEYTLAVDIGSFCRILSELVVGRPVFEQTMSLRVLMDRCQSGIRPDVPESLNLSVRDVIARRWSVDPKVCYSFDEILALLWGIEFKLRDGVNTIKVREFTGGAKGAPPRRDPAMDEGQSHILHQALRDNPACQSESKSIRQIISSFAL
jgi:hypothetical protein